MTSINSNHMVDISVDFLLTMCVKYHESFDSFLPISGRYAVQSFVTLQLSSEAELGDRPAACMLNV